MKLLSHAQLLPDMTCRNASGEAVVLTLQLLQCEVMVTAGANQAFTNVVLTLLDAKDSVVLFKPYYFNHLMAVQMTGGGANTILGRYAQCVCRTLHCYHACCFCSLHLQISLSKTM